MTIAFTALSFGVAEAHFLELPAKLGFSGEQWLTLLQTLYPPGFGTAGATFEVGAVISSIALVVAVRKRRPALAWTVVGAVAVIAAHAAFWIWVAPVNATLLPLTPETLPADWVSLRNQWEYTHATRAVLQFIALGAYVMSILVETPNENPGADGIPR